MPLPALHLPFRYTNALGAVISPHSSLVVAALTGVSEANQVHAAFLVFVSCTLIHIGVHMVRLLNDALVGRHRFVLRFIEVAEDCSRRGTLQAPLLRGSFAAAFVSSLDMPLV